MGTERENLLVLKRVPLQGDERHCTNCGVEELCTAFECGRTWVQADPPVVDRTGRLILCDACLLALREGGPAAVLKENAAAVAAKREQAATLAREACALEAATTSYLIGISTVQIIERR